MRKIFIAFISLAAVLAIYLFYGRVSKTPLIPMDTDTEAEFIDSLADSNDGGLENDVGMIGQVGVSTVRKARYITLNENKEVEREWGFEKLLHEVRDLWEIEKPYMNIYQRNVKFYITADKGNVQVETVVGKSTPKDATFTGNVVISILPEGSSNVKKSNIYLDDITFLSEKSQLSTTGSVKFISEDAQMLGTGMELIYDNRLERLDYLRIIDLENLRIRSSQAGFRSDANMQANGTADTGGLAKMQQPDEPVVASDKGQTQTTVARPEVEQGKGEYYKCIFGKNVLIDSPEQLVFAHDKIAINDIFWSKASNGQSNDADAGTAEQGPQSPDDVNTNNVTVSKQDELGELSQNEPNESSGKFKDIVVTCDGGFIVTPMASAKSEEYSEKFSPNASIITGTESPKELEDANDRTTFVTRTIDYSASTDDTIAVGASELTFYTNDLIQAEPNQTKVPVKVTSQKLLRFMPALNQVILEGDCVCEMLREDPNGQQRYQISGPRFIVELLPEKDKRSSDSGHQIKHFTADGGVVKLANVKMANEKVSAGVELKCLKCDYDTALQLFLATGPGVIKLYNSDVPEPNSQPDRFSLNKPCWAVIENFQTLKYFFQKNQLIADATSQGVLNVNYFPIVNGQVLYDQQVTVTAAHVQADLIETAEGELKLSTLNATGGITYEDQDKEFNGSKLFYDAGKSIITVQGNELQPCRFNGVPVDEIEWDLKTDKIKFEISGPGALQLNR
ncbi:MAG TPA: hypothetical protein VMW72_25850 [Sedimentisphaerales bacterium]|nr:hypothetical protein [Sedimentisphaerales bacterium]